MDLQEIYEKSKAQGNSFSQRLLSRFRRSRYAYWSVLTGKNPVIGTSTHEYKKLKAFLIYVGGFSPLVFKSLFIQKAVELTRSNKKLIIIPTLIAMYSIAIPSGALIMYFLIQAWSGLRSMYFASYLGTLAFIIDDPNHRIYKESKIMRNAL
ncbi:unnamed protein product [Blepharisma stoltei]|uniref:Uncharacterized protein n=1 Tax=Blepharisma stoltei TaxID=1481888 RepID=A0AAU9IPU3_9CILI|nr:unnamed protein product [Blepharisma stoltei]